MIGLLLAFYPARWRLRYEEEFRAVLESRPLGPFDVADVLLGALDARLTPFRLSGTDTGGHRMLLRIGGISAIFGGAGWFTGIAIASGLTGNEGRAWLPLALVGSLGLLVALIGLSAFQGHRDARLAWIAVVVPGAGAVVAAIGLAGLWLLPEDALVLGVLSAWNLWMIGLLANLVGSVFFAIVTYQARVLSRWAATTLGISCAAALIVMLGSMGGEGSSAIAQTLLVSSIAAFAGSWVWLGISALRRGPIRAVVPS